MSLEDRIQRLEVDSKAWRLIAGLLAAGLTVGAACTAGNEGAASRQAGAAPVGRADGWGNMIRASAIVIVNENGQQVGSLLGVTNGAMLDLRQPNGNGSISLSTLGSPSVSLSGENGTAGLTPTGFQLAAVTDEYRSAMKSLRDAQAAEAPTTPEQFAKREQLARVVDEKRFAKRYVAIGHGDSGGGVVEVYNALGMQVASVQAAKSNKGLVVVNNLNGEFSKALTAE